MKYLPSPSIILSFTLGGLVLGSHLVFGFTEPTQLPGGGNVFPPLDVSATAQAKAGGLILNAGNGNGAGGGPYGLIVDQGSVIVGNNYQGIFSVQGSTSTTLGIFNQTGSGSIADFQEDGNTTFNVKHGGIVNIFGNLCINNDCLQSWFSTQNLVPNGFITKNREGQTAFSTVAPSNGFGTEGDVVIGTTVTLSGYHYYNSLRISDGAIVMSPQIRAG